MVTSKERQRWQKNEKHEKEYRDSFKRSGKSFSPTRRMQRRGGSNWKKSGEEPPPLCFSK
ncbi:hypothetical protein PIB30_039583, partial [Stylosanthes scabra]|nr:hypothetical protein [Stylosanthes scabra]